MRRSPLALNGKDMGGKQGLVIAALVVAVIASMFWVFKSSRGDTDAASKRAETNASPSAVAKQYENTNLPPQARAAAMAAAQAHGAESQSHNK